MLLKELVKKNLIKKQVPGFLVDNTHYLALMGSVAYGCSEDYSDMDIYGWCIPPKEYVFPHTAGYIAGFGKQPPNFENWQEHHIQDDQKKREYDISIYGIIKYFQLITENNPNMIDSLFVPINCVLHASESAQMLRENRHLFLHKGCWHKFKGYAFSQLNKCKTIDGEPVIAELVAFEEIHNLPHSAGLAANINLLTKYGANANDILRYNELYAKASTEKKRAINTKIFGYDVKFAYHVVRLIDEAAEILYDHDLTLDKYSRREMLKSIRRGEWKFEEIQSYFRQKEADLDKLYRESTLRHSPDEDAIKKLLLNILESHYGNIENAIANIAEKDMIDNFKAINAIIEPYKKYF